MRRILFATLLIAGLFAALPATSHAAGAPFKGRYIFDSHTFSGVTGSCTCQTQWYTIGVNPGQFRVHAVLKGYGADYTPSYALRLILFDGKKNIDFQQVACTRKQRSCNGIVTINRAVHQRSIYYLKVEGPGGQDVRYTIRFQASFRRMTCRAKCF